MASSAVSPRRNTRTPGRPVRTLASIEPATEPPLKKRKFMPGGPGGGGYYIDDDGNKVTRRDAIASGLVPSSVPRARSRRPPPSSALKPATEPSMPPASARPTRPRRERPDRYVPLPSTPRPRYSNAAAAAAASQVSDGYKPREERSWEDFHPDLKIDAGLLIYSANEVDGRNGQNDPHLQKLGLVNNDQKTTAFADSQRSDVELEAVALQNTSVQPVTIPMKRKPGRPPRRPESMLNGLGSPPAPRVVPLPTHNPKERLTLPKPSYRKYNHYLQYEDNQKENKDNYVDRTMAHCGYQESDQFALPNRVLVRLSENQQTEDDAEVGLRLESDGPVESSQTALVSNGRVEYDMDEQDVAWLDDLNEHRKRDGVDAIKPAVFEITMTQIEKEYHALEKRIPKPQPRHAQTHRPRSSSQAAVNGDPNPLGDEPDSKCSICDDGDCENANAIIFCDGCDLAVHQECYGVPFIPEGQWFCRKCKEIGRGTPTCIFCPNVDGAFKQTNTLRWSHLLCAIWIPEVTIANMTFMEPIQDVEKVPRSRWKLGCYICNQKMGACIQCGNKNCYQAFHVTCARRARLFLKMKSQHQGGIDTTALKAFCDKHVPTEWRRVHETDSAIVEAKRWYRHTMKDRKWANSQSAALELGAPPQPDGGPVGESAVPGEAIATQKRRRNNTVSLTQTSGWRLASSGAPVVPFVVYVAVEANLARFTIRKKKEFLEKACRYWTLKREARRGAALLKRLQLQLEGFSTMEITRRDFAAMGAVGGPRLERRVGFGEMLQKDMNYLNQLCGLVKQREQLRLQDIQTLREVVDTVYFPIIPLLWPILERAQKLDEKSKAFTSGFESLTKKLRERHYTSVSDFSRDLSQVFSRALASGNGGEDASGANIETIHSKLNEIPARTAEHNALSHEQKELKKLAKRIVKAVKEPLEIATRKEATLRGREMEEEIRRLESMPIFATAGTRGFGVDYEEETEALSNPQSGALNIADNAGKSGAKGTSEHTRNLDSNKDNGVQLLNQQNTPRSKAASSASSDEEVPLSEKPTEPLSPPISRASCASHGALSISDAKAQSFTAAHGVYAHGGVPWYLEPFDPIGTTIHEERYTGRAVLREMSEELSDMDEDTLTELAPVSADAPIDSDVAINGAAIAPFQAASRSNRRRVSRRSQWSRARR